MENQFKTEDISKVNWLNEEMDWAIIFKGQLNICAVRTQKKLKNSNFKTSLIQKKCILKRLA